MKDSELKCLNKLLTIKEIEANFKNKMEWHIIKDHLAESTLDIWTSKDFKHPKLYQYKVYQNFILRYDLAFSGFINPVVDLFHYNLKDVVRCDEIDKITVNNIEEYFKTGTKINKQMLQYQ